MTETLYIYIHTHKEKCNGKSKKYNNMELLPTILLTKLTR
jgi:hypothetical protein